MRELWRHLAPYHGRAYLIVLYAAAATGLELGLEMLLRPLVDRGIMQGDFPYFLRILGLQVACYAAGVALNVVHVRAYVQLSADVSEDLRLRLFEKGLGLPLSYYTAANSAAIPSRITNEVGNVAAVLGQTFGSFGVALLQAAAATAILFSLSWKLALVVLFLLPLNAWFARRAGTLTSELEGDYYALYEEVQRFLLERFSFSARLLFSDPAARAGAGRGFRGQAARMKEIGVKLSVLPHWLSLAAYAISILTVLAVYALGGFMTIRGEISLGTLLAFLAIKSFLERPVSTLAATHLSMREALVHWGRIREILDHPAELPSSGRPFVAGPLRLENVTFRHPGGGLVLEGASAELPSRKLVALVGPTGTGKSTLTYLLQKHLEPQSGRILSGDADLREISADSLREQVAYLGQEPLLLSGDIRDNLVLHRPDATQEEILEACRLAALEPLIARLPQGLATRVADDGAALSGGEKQRICLARAILKRPAVLILDEPTAALDEQTEQVLCRALRALVDERGATVIAVTHRRAVADAADLVLKLQDGKLAPLPAGRLS
jgi:ATP-binding cassette subfamily B protein